MRKIGLLLLAFIFIGVQALNAQGRFVSGTVTSSEDGSTIPGVSVVVTGTSIGTITSMDGTYRLNVPEGSKTLKFSFVGMKTIELPITGTTVNVQMEVESIGVDEVMVVAYGTSKKSSFTGSAERLDNEKLAKIQSASVAKSLEGAAPGIQVTGGNGQPGSSAAIRIRGIGSVNASSAPLYVVDGAPYDGALNTINTNDIESITVLKDATSAALYGARGANGVIIITTKKGSAGKTTVNFKSSLGAVSRAIPEYDRVSVKDYYELMWEGWKTALVKASGFTPENAAIAASGATTSGIVAKLGGYNSYDVANDKLIGLDGKLNPAAKLLYYDDWQKALQQTGLRQDYNLALSGGNEKSSYYASVAYLDEEGMTKWSNYDRMTARVGAATQVNRWMKFDANLSGSSSNQFGFVATGTATTNPFYFGRMMGPIYPIYQYDKNGNAVLDGNGNKMYDLGGGSSIYKWAGRTRPYAPNSNLVLTLPLDERSTRLNTLSARVGLEISFLKDFKFRISGNTDISNAFYTTYQNYLYADAEAVKGRSTKNYTINNSYTINEVLSWSKQLGSHNLAFLAGHENYQIKSSYVSATRTGFTIPTTELVAAGTAEGSTSGSDAYALEGYLSQLNYDYAGKYYFSGSFRYDGSSRFYRDVRWGSFWSLGGSWRISEENFMNNISWLDNLKLKVSAGEQGNDDIGTYYGWQSLYSIDGNNNANFNGAIHSQLENRELKWEKNTNVNIGVEFGVFNRIRGGIDLFRRESSNLLFSVPLPQSTGISAKWGNIGTMNNQGIEFQISADVLKIAGFTWNIDLNGTAYKNEITKMPLGNDGKPQEIISGTKKLSEGHSIYDFWLREYAGVDETDGSALYYLDEKDADGKVTGRVTTKDQNAASYYYINSSIPDLYGGVTNAFAWKGLELSVLVTYQLGGYLYDSNWAGLMHTGAFGTHFSTDILNRWQKAGDKTDVPRLQNNYTAGTAASSRYLLDASFWSLRNITLSYTLPSKWMKSLDIQSAKLFATGDNLGLLTTKKGMDPQQNFGGTTDWSYVPSKIISFGVNVTF